MTYLHINPPHSEDNQTIIPVTIPAEIVIIDGIESYWIEGTDIEEIPLEHLKEIIIDLIKLEK